MQKKWFSGGWVLLGALLCIIALVLSVMLQQAGYLTYLNSDMSSEIILARRQADTHSLLQMDWLYSTEIHFIHMNLFYALAFLFTPDYALARIIGNTVVFVLGMASCVCLCRKARLSWGAALCTAALLPVSAGTLYAQNMTIGGYYIIHLVFAYLTAALWIDAVECAGSRKKKLLSLAAFAAFCMVEGALSVRYVLCFVCPVMAAAAFDVLLAPSVCLSLRDRPLRTGLVTAAGFVSAAAGYAASEIIYPMVFTSGTRGAAGYEFAALDGQAMMDSLFTVAADFLKLLGWRGEVSMFSVSGIVNLCITGVLVLGGVMTVRVMRGFDPEKRRDRAQRMVVTYAFAALMINLFCFVCIKDTYYNRYLIPAVMPLIPAAAVIAAREKNLRLRNVFLLLLCAQVAIGSVYMIRVTGQQEKGAQARGQSMMDAAQFLQENGYTHGYGSFWNVRVMQERTQGALTFTGVAPSAAQEGAVCDMVPDLIRWLEPEDYSDMDYCMRPTFMLLTTQEEEQLSGWIDFAGLERLYSNDDYSIYAMESSQQYMSDMLFGKMKLENAAYEGGMYRADAQGRMCVPTSWMGAGRYALRFEKASGAGSAEVYATRHFEVIARQEITGQENELVFELPADDKYFMILLKTDEGMELSGMTLEKLE